jgi:hypothetical protein
LFSAIWFMCPLSFEHVQYILILFLPHHSHSIAVFKVPNILWIVPRDTTVKYFCKAFNLHHNIYPTVICFTVECPFFLLGHVQCLTNIATSMAVTTPSEEMWPHFCYMSCTAAVIWWLHSFWTRACFINPVTSSTGEPVSLLYFSKLSPIFHKGKGIPELNKVWHHEDIKEWRYSSTYS